MITKNKTIKKNIDSLFNCINYLLIWVSTKEDNKKKNKNKIANLVSLSFMVISKAFRFRNLEVHIIEPKGQIKSTQN